MVVYKGCRKREQLRIFADFLAFSVFEEPVGRKYRQIINSMD